MLIAMNKGNLEPDHDCLLVPLTNDSDTEFVEIVGNKLDSSFPFVVSEGTRDYPLSRKMLSNDTHVIDIGAGYGEFSARALELGAKSLQAFEPNPVLFDYLGINLKKYGSRASAVPSAVFDESGTTRLLVMQHRSAAGSIDQVQINPDTPRALERESIVAAMVSANEISIPIGINHIVVKIDAEGSEYKIMTSILSSTWSARISQLFIEFHFGEGGLVSQLQESGFCVSSFGKSYELGLIHAYRDKSNL